MTFAHSTEVVQLKRRIEKLEAEGPAYSEGFQAGKMFAELVQADRVTELEAENEQLRDRLDFVCRLLEDITQDIVVPEAVRNFMENDIRLRQEEQP